MLRVRDSGSRVARRSQESSRRTIAAPATSAASLPKATARGRYFMPQSGAGISFSGATYLQAAADALRDLLGGLDRGIPEIQNAEHDLLAGEIAQHAEIDPGLRGFDRDLLGYAVRELRQEGIAMRLGRARHHRGIAEADVHHGRDRDAFERTVDRLHPVALGGLRIVAQPRLVELDHVGARLLQVARLLR